MNDVHARILLVDDAAFAFKFLGALLEEAGSRHTLEWRATYETGKEALLGGGFDLCLLDIQLGERSGLDFLREVIAAGCKTPVVILTGQGSRTLDVETMRAGAADYLVKGEFNAESFDRVVRYVVERARTVEALRESEERYALALKGSNDGVWDWRVGEPKIHLSARWKQIIGFDEHELPDLTESWWSRVHDEDRPVLTRAFEDHIAGRTAHLENEHRLRHRDGTFRHVLVRGQGIRDKSGRATRLAGSLTDVTSARSHDVLTRLPNRVLFIDRLEHCFLRMRRDAAYTFAVLFIDIDRFKNINDSLGHAAGDALLVEIARRLERCVRAVDTVARLGGDEFVALLDEAREPDGPIRVATRIIDELAKPFVLDGKEVFSGASVGIALSGPDYQAPGELMRDADTAMYRAKSEGRGRAVVFDSEMHTRAMRVLSVESGLRRAIEERGLEVHYQPVFTFRELKLVGFEALVRWRHPERGLVAPNEFLPIAEDSSLIVLVDLYVMRLACERVAAWRALVNAPLFISVNASRRHFAHASFAGDVEQILDAAGLPPSSMRLEVTESITMESSEASRNQLEKLGALGVDLVVDDFGIGYSSLALLQQYPFRGLKIDRAFVAGLPESKKAAELVRAIVTMAGALGLSTTAEGVETDEQLDLLASMGCHALQGFRFARPMPDGLAQGFLEKTFAEGGSVKR